MGKYLKLIESLDEGHLTEMPPPAPPAIKMNPWNGLAAVAFNSANHPVAEPRTNEVRSRKTTPPEPTQAVRKKWRFAR